MPVLEAAEEIASEPPQPVEVLQESDEAPKTEVLLFDLWNEVLEKLASYNPAICGALSGSQAYLKEDLLLIDSQNPIFRKMIRENEYSKDSIRRAALEVTGRKFRLGPFNKSVHKQIAEEKDPLENFLQKAQQEGIEIKIK